MLCMRSESTCWRPQAEEVVSWRTAKSISHKCESNTRPIGIFQPLQPNALPLSYCESCYSPSCSIYKGQDVRAFSGCKHPRSGTSRSFSLSRNCFIYLSVPLLLHQLVLYRNIMAYQYSNPYIPLAPPAPRSTFNAISTSSHGSQILFGGLPLDVTEKDIRVCPYSKLCADCRTSSSTTLSPFLPPPPPHAPSTPKKASLLDSQ